MDVSRRILIISVMNQECLPIISQLSLSPDPSLVNPFCEGFSTIFNSLSIFLIKPKNDPKFKVESVNSEIAALIAYIGITHYKPLLVINAGSSGSLHANADEGREVLQIGDVCTGEEVKFFDREMILPEYKEYVEGKYETSSFDEICRSLEIKKVSIGTSSSFANEYKKEKIAKVDIAEMEAAAIGKVCFWMKTKLFLLKVVSDVPVESEEKRQKMFEECVDSASVTLAKKLHSFLLQFEKTLA